MYEVATGRFDFRQLVNEFKEGGISLENFRTGEITAFSEIGEDSLTNLDLIETQINSGVTTRFKWWIYENTDLLCQIDIQDTIVRQDCGFIAGLEPDEAKIVISTLQARFERLARANLGRMMLVDLRKYPSEEVDWHEFLLGKGTIERIEDLPDVLILKSQELGRINLDLTDRSDEFCPGFARVTREQCDSGQRCAGFGVSELFGAEKSDHRRDPSRA